MIKEISLMALCIVLAVAGLFYTFCETQSIALLILTKVVGAGMLFVAYMIDKNYKPSKQD